MRQVAWVLGLVGVLAGCGSKEVHRRGSATGGLANPVCVAGASAGPVQRPVKVRNIPSGETGWYASPVVSDLGDPATGQKIVAAYYSLFVYDAGGKLLDKAKGNGSRVYAPHVVARLTSDAGAPHSVVVGQGDEVIAYDWVKATTGTAGHLQQRWAYQVETGGEVRGLAAADLDGDGTVEVVATTTASEKEVYVLDSAGKLFQPAGTAFQAWPRYNDRTGAGGDADRNGEGLHGYGCYGLNVGIGNIDDDPGLEIVVTYDNHEIEAFDYDGVSLDASPWFTNRSSQYEGQPLAWGQFIRWADPVVEANHYHLHTGAWPNPGRGQEWLQWTASPPSVVDLNGDGRSVVVGVPNVEKNEPYETQAYAVMVLEGAHGGGSRSAMRLPGWEVLPRGEAPVLIDGWYPPGGVPATAVADIQGDARLEIVVSLNDLHFHAFDADAHELWYYDYGNGKRIRYASEAAIADLNQDGSPEIVFATYGDPESGSDSGHLVVLAANGAELFNLVLENQGDGGGNGSGAPAAPTIADVDGDGQLEILVQTFDHGLDVYKVPGSGASCVPWPTSRGGPLRMGAYNEN